MGSGKAKALFLSQTLIQVPPFHFLAASFSHVLYCDREQFGMGASRSAAAGGGDRGAKAGGNKPTTGAFVAQAGQHLKRLELAGGTDTLFRKRIQWVAAKVPAVLAITKKSNLFRKYQEIHLEELDKLEDLLRAKNTL